MTDDKLNQTPARPTASRGSRLALALAVLALAASGAQWLGLPGGRAADKARSEEAARLQRRLNSLEDRIQRERDDLQRLVDKIGAESQAEGTLAGRLARLEEATARMPGGENVRFLWLVEQAEYFLRIANAQENLAGNSTGALRALEIADEHLRDAADPRLSPVRRLVAAEIKALRGLPRVDTEGMALQLASLSAALPDLPRRQSAPSRFSPEPAPPEAGASGMARAGQALRNAFLSVVSVRRTDAPTATLLTEEAAGLLGQSLDLELQMARLALLRGEAQAFRASVAAVRRGIEKYYDTASPAGADALAVLDQLGAVKMAESLPDISASLAELIRVKERESRS